VVAYDIPLTATAEVEGVLILNKDSGEVTVSGVKIQALNTNGQIVGETVSEYDGYFYFDNLPAKSLTILVHPDAVQQTNGRHEPVQVKLSRDNPTALGVRLAIDMS